MAQVALTRLYKQFPHRPNKGAQGSGAEASSSGEQTAVNVLRDINLTVRDGEFMVLVGPSGCGKSTLLRLIAGLESVTAGTIQVSDRAVNHLPPKQRDIAMVFQNYALYPHMTVYDNLAFGLRRISRENQSSEASPAPPLAASDSLSTDSSSVSTSVTKQANPKQANPPQANSQQTPASDLSPPGSGIESPKPPATASKEQPPIKTHATVALPALGRSQTTAKGTHAKPSPASDMSASPWKKRVEGLLVGLTRSLPRWVPQSWRYQSEEEKAIAKRVQTVAHMLQIDMLLDRLPKQLSGGQKQRVALGRAMARNPQVFLMDEPLSNLDAKLRLETRAQIVSLQRRLGTTTIYVTHDQTEAMTMGDRIAVMNQGQIQQVAAPLDLYNHPANRFVAEFIGSLPMNFLTVTVSGARLITHPAFRLTVPDRWESILRSYEGRSLLLGIRPEHLQVSVPAPKNLATVVERVETLGSDTYLTARLTETDRRNPVIIQARVSPENAIAQWDELWLSITPDKIHLFDPKTEQAIRPDASR